MWNVRSFLSEQANTEQSFEQALRGVNSREMSCTELLRIDTNVRTLNPRGPKDWRADDVHERVVKAILEAGKDDPGRFKEIIPTLFTLWRRERTCKCFQANENCQKLLKCFSLVLGKTALFHEDERVREAAQRFVSEQDLTLMELVELERDHPFDWNDDDGIDRRLTKELQERIRASQAPWQEWYDASTQVYAGSCIKELCKKRFVADLVEGGAPFAAWYERLRWMCTEKDGDTHFYVYQKDALVRTVLAGLERTAETFHDWDTLHRLTYPSKRSQRVEEMMRNLLLET